MAYESVPDKAKKPQDHKPPAQREVEGENVIVTWQGQEVELPATVDDWDADALEAWESGKALTGLRMLLGSRRYDELREEFRKNNGRKSKVGDFTPLFEEIAKLYGFETAGN